MLPFPVYLYTQLLGMLNIAILNEYFVFSFMQYILMYKYVCACVYTYICVYVHTYGGVQGRVGWRPGQPCVVLNVEVGGPACGREVGAA